MEETLWAIAKRLRDEPGFLTWLGQRLEAVNYWGVTYERWYIQEVMELLGASRLNYQYWERKRQEADEALKGHGERTWAERFPVPVPQFVKPRGGGPEQRAYSPEEVVRIAYWYWQEKS